LQLDLHVRVERNELVTTSLLRAVQRCVRIPHEIAAQQAVVWGYGKANAHRRGHGSTLGVYVLGHRAQQLFGNVSTCPVVVIGEDDHELVTADSACD
jgi:hypothetical protein